MLGSVVELLDEPTQSIVREHEMSMRKDNIRDALKAMIQQFGDHAQYDHRDAAIIERARSALAEYDAHRERATHDASQSFGHAIATGTKNERHWKARGNVQCVAVRGANGKWRLVEGPARLVNREYKNIRDLRNATTRFAQ